LEFFMKTIRVLLSLFFLCLSVNAAGEKIPFAVENIGPSIYAATTGGYWEDGGKSGNFRVIVENRGWERVVSRLYLQWVAQDESKRESVVLKTVPVSEVNAGGVWTLGAPVISLTGEGPEITISATHTYTNENKFFKIRPGKPGKYKLLP
jgi:hypothetical protein